GCAQAPAGGDGRGDLRRLRPSLCARVATGRWHDRAVRDRLPAPRTAGLDAATPGWRRMAAVASAGRGAAAAGGRGGRDLAVELPDQPGPDSADHGDRRGQPRLPQPVRTDAAYVGFPG